MKKMFCCALALILALAALVGCAGGGDSGDKAVVMRVGDFDVPLEIYRYFALNYKSDYEGGEEITAGDAAAAALDEYVGEYTEESLRRCYAVLTLASRCGLSLADDDIKKSVQLDVDYYKEQYGGESGYNDALADGDMNDSVFRFILGEQYMEEKLYYHLISTGELDDDEEKVDAALRGDGFVRVKQVLILNDAGEDAEANRALAESIRERALAGESFDSLVSQYSDDVAMKGNTDGYYFTRGEMIEGFEAASFALGVGGISDVVETHLGYSVILRLEPEEEYIARNYETLREKYLTSLYNAMVNDIAESLVMEETVDVDLFSLDTTDAGGDV